MSSPRHTEAGLAPMRPRFRVAVGAPLTQLVSDLGGDSPLPSPLPTPASFCWCL